MTKLATVLLAAVLLFLPLELRAQAPCGDCRQDGTINVLDSLLASQAAAGLPVALGPCCDVAVPPMQPDGFIDVLDALRIAQYAAGIVTTLRCDCPPFGYAVLAAGQLITYSLSSTAPSMFDSVMVAGPAPYLLAAQRDLDRCFTAQQGAAANVEVWNLDLTTATFVGVPQNVPLPAGTVARGLTQDERGGYFYLVNRADPSGCLSAVACSTTPTPSCLGQLLYFADFGLGPQLQWTAAGTSSAAGYSGLSFPASRPNSTQIWVTDLDVVPPLAFPGCSTFPGLQFFDNVPPIAAGVLAPVNPTGALRLLDVEWDAAGNGLLVTGEVAIAAGAVPLLAMLNTVAGPSFGATLALGGGPFPFPAPFSPAHRLTLDGANQRGWLLNDTHLVEFTYTPSTVAGTPGVLMGVSPTIDLGVTAADLAFNPRTQTLTLGGFPTSSQITVIDIPPGGIASFPGGALPTAVPLTVSSDVQRVVTY